MAVNCEQYASKSIENELIRFKGPADNACLVCLICRIELD